MIALSTGCGISDAPALLRWITLAQPGVSARQRSTSGSIGNPHAASFAAPDHRADSPAPVALEELNAVDAAVEDLTAARAPRLIRAEHMGHVAEQPRLAPDLALPEARQLARGDHLFEVLAVGRQVEFEHAGVVDSHHPRTRRKNLPFGFPVGTSSALVTDAFVHRGDDRIEVVHGRIMARNGHFLLAFGSVHAGRRNEAPLDR